VTEANQFGNLRRFDHALEHATKATTVTTARRCGQTQQHGVRIARDDLLVGAGNDVMCFVDHDQIGGRQIHAVRTDGSL
jgi:hypothetical protein